MSESSAASLKAPKLLQEVLAYVDQACGLKVSEKNQHQLIVWQEADNKSMNFLISNLEEVLHRMDMDGKPFIQVNLSNGVKILFTDKLIGFKPKEISGLDMSKIPKVVTTPDLSSVFSAIEEGLSSESITFLEIEILKKVFAAILQGGELAGFELSQEKKYLERLISSRFQASA